MENNSSKYLENSSIVLHYFYITIKQFVIRLVEGLSGAANSVSFESTSRPGYYLCKAGNRIIVVRMTNNAQMLKDCTFVAWSDRFFDGYVSFESSTHPGYSELEIF